MPATVRLREVGSVDVRRIQRLGQRAEHGKGASAAWGSMPQTTVMSSAAVTIHTAEPIRPA
ncbi:MAG: hypothetical protein ACLUW6_00880 [Coriobacteriaceae bacterium]